MSDTPTIPSHSSLLGQVVEVAAPAGQRGRENDAVGKRGVIISSWVQVYQSDTINKGILSGRPCPETSQTIHTATTLVQLRFEDGEFSKPLVLSRLKMVALQA